jgi:hypothetical protein
LDPGRLEGNHPVLGARLGSISVRIRDEAVQKTYRPHTRALVDAAWPCQSAMFFQTPHPSSESPARGPFFVRGTLGHAPHRCIRARPTAGYFSLCL